jgi:pimeloyl-ACP methyl ester carboxylesterase
MRLNRVMDFKDKIKRTLILIIASLAFSHTAYSKECVILLHGLAKTNHSMEKISNSLEDEGYITVNYDYPSRTNSIDNLAQTHIKKALEQCPKRATIHFVTHSMGGILVRQYLHTNKVNHLGKVVMLGPPNQGSEVVDKLHELPGYAQLGGPAALELGTDGDSVPAQLGPANFDLGIIAGSRSINLVLSTLLPNQDDGKVSVDNTKLSGMNDHITLPVTHPFMMKNNKVISEIKHFLKNGVFSV